MNDEIKEIIDDIKDYSEHEYLPLCCELTNEECKHLLDYITNLQQDNTMYAQLKDEYEEDIKDLQQENERLKEALNCKEYFSSTMPEDTEFVILTKNNYNRQQKDIQFELIDYKSRCEKAYEELTYMSSSDYVEDYDIKQNCWIKLSNILQKGIENEKSDD